MKHSFVILGIAGLLLQACAGTKNENKTSANSYQTIDVTALDRTIKPADDFFTFANGTWVAKTEIPASESRWGSFNELEQQNNIKLKAILNEAVANPGAKGSQNQLLGAYFKSFTDMQKRDQLGIAPIKEDLQKIENLQNTAQIQGLLSSFHKDGIGTLFGYGIGQDLKNVNINVAYMGQGGIGLPNRDYYFDEKYQSVLTAYEQHISKCFGLAGLSTDPQIATQILALEKALAS